MKKHILAALLTALLLLPSCKNEQPGYRTDLSAGQLSEQCLTSVSSHELLAPADEDYIRYRLLLEDDMMESCVVYIQNAGTALDEIGIVKALDEDTTAIESAVQNYLKQRNEEWTGQYMVEEYPKLEAAEYRTIGQYVVYAILSEEDKVTFFDAAAKSLTADQ